MRVLKRQAKTSPFVPDYMAHSLRDVDFELLSKKGVRYIAFDADSTLVKFWGKQMDPQTREFLMKQHKLFEKWCIASNRFTNDLGGLGESIDAPIIRANLWMRKPHRLFYEKVINLFDAQPHEIAMIGDKLFADIWGAKKAGMVTVWVKKLGPDSPWDWLLRTRYFEQRIFKRYMK